MSEPIEYKTKTKELEKYYINFIYSPYINFRMHKCTIKESNPWRD